MSKSFTTVRDKLAKGFIRITERSLKSNANSTTSTWSYQPKVPAKINQIYKLLCRNSRDTRKRVFNFRQAEKIFEGT